MDDLVRLLLISTLAAALVGCSSSASQQPHPGFEYADRGLYRTHYEQSSQVHSQRRVLHGPTITAKKTNARHRQNADTPALPIAGSVVAEPPPVYRASVLWWPGYYDYAPGQFGRGPPRYGGYGSDNSTKIAAPHNAPKRDASSFVRPGDKSNILTTAPTIPTKTEIPQSSKLSDEAKKTEISPSSQLNDEAKKTEISLSSQLNDEAKKTEISPSSQFNDESKKTEISPSSELDDESVIQKAKATIAAKMSDSDSVEFKKVERAVSKNALGNSIDTICGFVQDKNSGPKLFLYIVQKDEAYIGSYPIATTQYRNVCSITTLGR
jgi:hypothetical protein